MKQAVTLFMLFSVFTNCAAQPGTSSFTSENFEKQILAYQPEKGNLTEKDYMHGLMILNEVKKDVENNPANFVCPDYFNILSCFLSLQENTQTIELAFQKFKNAEGSCDYFLSKGLFESEKYNILRSAIKKQIAICSTDAKTESKPSDIKEYASKNNLNYNLVQLMVDINNRDQMYRADKTTDFSKQTPLDLKNQQLIDSLYTVYQKYIGTSIAGEKYNYIMWSVIQHSNPEMMKKYIPVVHRAVKNGNLDATPFKMLIDRYYGLTYGYQVYGSQSGFGFKMATDAQKIEIEQKYGLK